MDHTESYEHTHSWALEIWVLKFDDFCGKQRNQCRDNSEAGMG